MRDQATGLRRQLETVNNLNQAKTISIVSGKGGVGKSNTALNFSLELQKRKKKVLLFDLDVGMGNIDIMLGLHAKYTIIDMFNDLLPIHDIIERGPKDLSYIAAGSGLVDLFTLNEAKMDYFLKQYKQLVKMYDYIIFDLGAGATSDSLFFILASDECIVITTPEPTSITDAYSMVKHIVNKQRNMPIKVIMNRCFTEKIGSQSLIRFQRVIKQFLNFDIHLMGVLPEDKIVTTAVIRQIPYVLLNEKAAVSKAIKQITNNYLTNSKVVNKLEPFSFVRKFKQFMTER